MKVENGYLIVEKQEMKNIKKISAHEFVNLLGLNDFKLVGDTLLEMHSVFKLPSTFDPFYTKRGDVAERMMFTFYKREGYNPRRYKKGDFTNNDMFFYDEWFSGLVDISLQKDGELPTLSECKSKSLSAYDKISKNPPLDEVFQALLYGHLLGLNYIIMDWIFFDEKTEEEIKNDRPITTLQKVKRLFRQYNLCDYNMQEKCDRVINIVKNFRETGRIHLSQISGKVLNGLGINVNDEINLELPDWK